MLISDLINFKLNDNITQPIMRGVSEHDDNAVWDFFDRELQFSEDDFAYDIVSEIESLKNE